MSWKDGDFSEELLGVSLSEFLGKTVVCEDGVTRTIGKDPEDLVTSYRNPLMLIINERDPESKSGHFISVYSLCCQVISGFLPSREAIDAANKSIRNRYQINEDGTFDRPPKKSGLILTRSSIN